MGVAPDIQHRVSTFSNFDIRQGANGHSPVTAFRTDTCLVHLLRPVICEYCSGSVAIIYCTYYTVQSFQISSPGRPSPLLLTCL